MSNLSANTIQDFAGSGAELAGVMKTRAVPINGSGLVPLGHAVLIEPYEPEIKRGTIVIPDKVSNDHAMVEQRATVVAVGPAAWNDEARPRAVSGDRVLVTKFAGYSAVGPADGKHYRLVNDRDIFAAIVKEKDHG